MKPDRVVVRVAYTCRVCARWCTAFTFSRATLVDVIATIKTLDDRCADCRRARSAGPN